MTGLYLHIPFCRRKCSYCDFFSVTTAPVRLESYPDLLLRHLDWASKHRWTGPFDSVYFGGGTPSLMKPAAIGEILHEIRSSCGLNSHAEITFEANPGTVTQASLEGYRQAGITRLSLGLQTCNDRQLTLLGRLHDRREGLEAVSWARQAGFDDISLDLMFALPEQTLAELEEDLQSYLELAPEHLSCYGLTAEPGTSLYRAVDCGALALPDEEFYADAFLAIHEKLTAFGYEHYEIANYARSGHACRHNLGYWQRRPYLGIGAGAHSFDAHQWGSRWETPADLAAYRQALHDRREPMTCLERFDRDSALRETVYLGLRTREGITDSTLQQHFGCTLEEEFPEAVAASARWLQRDAGRWSLTPSGWLLFDRLILPFL